MVGEHSIRAEARPVRARGVYRRENVGMSNRNAGEKPAPRKPKVSVAMSINHGLGGPKAMTKVVVDGQTVNIPSPQHLCDGVTEDISSIALMVWRS